MKAYLAGPMQGIPQFNFPAFFDATDDLRSRGHTIVSPAEIDNEEDKGLALQSTDGNLATYGTGNTKGKKTWGDFLSRDVKLIADEGIDTIIFLPNWEKSKGARLEAFVGLLKGIVFFEYAGKGEDLIPAPPAFVAGLCAAQWMEEPFKKFIQQELGLKSKELGLSHEIGNGVSAEKAVTVAV